MSRLRTAGALLLLGGLLSYLGQFLAAYQWQGIFSLEYNVISDLGTTECSQLDDVFPTRFVCSPGHLWFSGGLVLGGIALLAAAVLLVRAGTDALGRALLAATPLAVGVGIAGLGMILGGAVAYDVQQVLHLSGLTVLVLGLWAAMAGSAWSSFRFGRLVEPPRDRAPVLSRAMLPVSVILLGISAVGLVLLLLSPGTAPLGLFLRLMVDPVLLWVIAAGAALLREGSPRRRREREDGRRQRRAEQRERDAALRKAVEQ